jgi:hypothetical protein
LSICHRPEGARLEQAGHRGDHHRRQHRPGTCDSAGVKNSSTSSTKPVAITVAQPVRAPE